MNCTILFLAAFAIVVHCIESRRPEDCRGDCDTAKCASAHASIDNCKCGTYSADRCDCCPSCQKCPREQCNIAAREKCTEGYQCKQGKSTKGSDTSNDTGTCVEVSGNQSSKRRFKPRIRCRKSSETCKAQICCGSLRCHCDDEGGNCICS